MKKSLKRGLLAMGALLVVVLLLFIFALHVGDKIRVAQDNNNELLHMYGERILDYRKEHGGASPPQIVDLLGSDEIKDQQGRHHEINTFVDDPMHSFAMPKDPASHVLVYEKPGMWTDGTVGVCLDDLTVKRLPADQTADLIK